MEETKRGRVEETKRGRVEETKRGRVEEREELSLEGYTVSNLGLQPGVSRLQGKISLEGYTPAKMVARAATPPLSLHFPFKIVAWERT